jgi:hypothetical protein
LLKSDHAPVLVILDAKPRKKPKYFKFENWWLLEKDYNATAKQS